MNLFLQHFVDSSDNLAFRGKYVVQNQLGLLRLQKCESEITVQVLVTHPYGSASDPQCQVFYKVYAIDSDSKQACASIVQDLAALADVQLCARCYCTSTLPLVKGFCMMCLYVTEQPSVYDDACPICLTPNNLTSFKTSCQHHFHEECLKRLVEHSNNNEHLFSCPSCRTRQQLTWNDTDDTFHSHVPKEHDMPFLIRLLRDHGVSVEDITRLLNSVVTDVNQREG